MNRSNYSADLGGASGASINIVTKSGTNDLHGSIYSYFRNSAMDARDPFAFSPALAPDPTFSNFNFTSVGAPVKNSLSRYQYGGTAGLPIQKDKTFLFFAFEGLLQNSENSVPLLTNSSIFLGPNPVAAANPFAPSDRNGSGDRPRKSDRSLHQQSERHRYVLARGDLCASTRDRVDRQSCDGPYAGSNCAEPILHRPV